jgi:hypothetical protein
VWAGWKVAWRAAQIPNGTNGIRFVIMSKNSVSTATSRFTSWLTLRTLWPWTSMC